MLFSKFILPASLGLAALIAVVPNAASAQRYDGWNSPGYSGYGYRDRGYNRGYNYDRGSYRDRQRWIARQRWVEQQRRREWLREQRRYRDHRRDDWNWGYRR